MNASPVASSDASSNASSDSSSLSFPTSTPANFLNLAQRYYKKSIYASAHALFLPFYVYYKHENLHISKKSITFAPYSAIPEYSPS
jgi:hypothetical protein